MLTELDWPLFLVIGLIVSIGLANLYSATVGTPHSAKFFQQLVWIGLGGALFLLATVVDYRSWHRVAWISLVVIVVSILVVRFVSQPINGSTRWLIVGPLRFQPSELAKIAVILAMARFLHDTRSTDHHRIANPLHALAALAALALPVLLIALQPDLGSAIMVLAIGVTVALLLVKNVWPVFGAIGVGLASLPLLWQGMEDYQKARVLALMDPEAAPLTKGWQTQQSLLAVGSGRITGKGYGEATQNRFNFLPEHWTDFPFSVWAEEWGFVGALGLLVLFALLVLLCVNAAARAPDRFGTAICLGVAALIFWQLVVNVGMVLGMAPVVGVTLPLISYGGSSMLTILIGLGLVSSVSMRRFKA
jgi:rod shape determining protein RodA